MEALYFSGMPRSGSQWLHQVLHRLKERVDLPLRVAHNHKPHEEFTLSAEAPLIGIYRDIRDVVVSAYFLNERRKEEGLEAHPWINKLTEGRTFDEGIRAMIEDPEHMVLKRYMDWYISFFGKPHVMLLRFEDATQNRYAIYEALHGLGFEVPLEAYLEAMEAYAYKRLKVAHPEHYRTGGRSTWGEVLSVETIRLIEEECCAFFNRADYPLHSLAGVGV